MFNFIVPPVLTDLLDAAPAKAAAVSKLTPRTKAAMDSQSLLLIPLLSLSVPAD